MSIESKWALVFLVFAFILGFTGIAAAEPIINDMKIEGTDAEGDPTGDEYSIRGVRIWVEGELDERGRETIGSLQILRQGESVDRHEGWFTISEGEPSRGGHLLAGHEGTIIRDGHVIETNADGEFLLSFILPFEVLTDGRYQVAHDPMDPSEPNPAVDGWAFQTVLRFTNAYTESLKLATLEFAIQAPRFYYVGMDDAVYNNGDTVSIGLEMETADANATKGWLCKFGRGIERLVLLPDFSNLDSAFSDRVKVNDEWTYDPTVWGERSAPGLYDLIQHVNAAKRDGRLTMSEDDGDYEVSYTISQDNVNASGRKRVRIYAIDFPEGGNPGIDEIEAIFSNAYSDKFDPSSQLNIVVWESGTFDTSDINLNNPMAPSITLKSPNGGELWRGGSSHYITWDTTGVGIDSISILYYGEEGGISEIGSILQEPRYFVWDLDNTGSYRWGPIPSFDSNTMKIVVSAYSDGHRLAWDSSDAYFTIDSTPPETTISLEGNQGENDWWTSDVSATLTAKDALSGVAKIEYRINGGEWQEFPIGELVEGVIRRIYQDLNRNGIWDPGEPFRFEISEPSLWEREFLIAETHSTIEYRSADAVGNVEPSKFQIVKIDRTAPNTPTVTDDGDCTIDGSRLHASFTSFDAESEIVEYKYAIGVAPGGTNVVDWTALATNRVTKTGLNLTLGETYYFSVKAKNEAGLWSSEAFSDGIRYELPEIRLTSRLDSPKEGEVINGTYYIEGIAGGPGFGQYELQFRVGDLPNMLNDIGINPRTAEVDGRLGEWDTTVLADGEYEIWLIVRDEAGNESVDSVTVNVQNTTFPFTRRDTQDFNDGRIGDFQVIQWEGQGQVDVFDVELICELLDLPDGACGSSGQAVLMRPPSGAGAAIKYDPPQEAGFDLAGDDIVIRMQALFDDAEISLILTDEDVPDGKSPDYRPETLKFFVTRREQGWVFTAVANGTLYFDKYFELPVEEGILIDYTLRFQRIGLREFICYIYIDGVLKEQAFLYTGRLELHDVSLYLATYVEPGSNSAGVFDNFKHESESTCNRFRDDRVAPTIESITINGGQEYTNSPSVTIEMVASDNVGGQGLAEAFIGGDLEYILPHPWPGAAPRDTRRVELYGADGRKTVCAIVVDQGCRRSEEVCDEITLDRTGPSVSITYPENQQIVSGQIDFIANVSDIYGIDKAIFRYGAVPKEFPIRSSDSVVDKWSHSEQWDTTTVNNGMYTLTVEAWDLAGNSSGGSHVTVNVSNIEVWPGDTNGDGLVNGVDAVFIGIYAYLEGPKRRPNPSCEWKAYMVEPWNPPEATRADANGSGKVDEDDFDCIDANWSSSDVWTAPGLSESLVSIDHSQHIPAYERLLEFLESRPKTEPILSMQAMLKQAISIGKSQAIPEKTAFFQNYPNPFNPETWIPYQLAEASEVSISIFTMSGELIRKLELGYRPAGFYLTKDKAAYWDGRNNTGEKASSGLYFCNIQIGDSTKVKKMILAK